MQSLGRNNPSRKKSGVTLVEVMLTLCLLVIIASLAWPMLDKPFAGQRLRKAAEMVRLEWCRARVEALNSGQTLMFRYTPYEGQFQLEAQACVATTDGGSGLSTPAQPQTTRRTLPEGITFVSDDTELDMRATTAMASESQTTSIDDADWSQPILFYPDGTTSTATLTLKNQYDRCVALKLRGLTGVVRIGEVFTSQGLSR